MRSCSKFTNPPPSSPLYPVIDASATGCEADFRLAGAVSERRRRRSAEEPAAVAGGRSPLRFAGEVQSIRGVDGGLPEAVLPAVVPRDGAEIAASRAILKTLLEQYLQIAVAFERVRGRPALPPPAWGRVAVPVESQLRFDGEGWAEVSIRLQLESATARRAGCRLDLALSLLPLEIPLLARVAQSYDQRELVVEWRLPKGCHPMLRPNRASGSVTSSPRYEFLTFEIPAELAKGLRSMVPESSVAEGVAPDLAAGAKGRGGVSRPRSGKVRSATIGYTRVESRGVLGLRRSERYVPTLRIVAQWLGAAGFGIGQRVEVQVGQGELILKAVESAEGDGSEVRP